MYNAKILLFGEHTVVKGSQALAMPINSHFGTWQYASDSAKIQTLQQNLPRFLQYLNTQGLQAVLDTDTFREDLQKGLYFHSSIPTGYGMGSSGALCAAIYAQYHKIAINEKGALKSFFGKMESFFHGASSGMDPLVCYLNYPVLFSQNGKIQEVQLHPSTQDAQALFLLDTHIPRKTAPFVNGFLERCKKPAYNKKCETILVPYVNQAINALLNKDWATLYEKTTLISFFQYDYFDFMVPDTLKPIWEKGMESDHFKLKICGAGGGGFLLGISKDYDTTKQFLKEQKLIRIL